MGTGALPPGPRSPRALQAVLWTWRYPEFTRRAHARYGSSFTARVGSLPTAVVTTDRDAIRRLFTGEPETRRNGTDSLRPFVGSRSVIVLEPVEHLGRRRLLSPPFHGERVQAYAELMERLVTAELEGWRPGEVRAVEPVAQALTLDVILQAVLGVSDPELRGRLRGLLDAMFTPLASFALTVPELTRRARWNVVSWRYWWLKDRFDGLLRRHISATRADPRLAEREDVLAMLVQARDESGAGLADEELLDELVTLISAGHETTASAIASGVELLAHHPAAASRIRAGDGDYLEAAVKEVLRVRSPLPLGAARHVLEPFPVGRWTIPPEVTVIVNAHGLHHDPAVYPDPEVFRPERFLESPPGSYEFLPFGGGAHRCLGASLAMLEIRIVLREMLARLELEPVAAEVGRPVRRAVTLAPRGGVQMRVVSCARPPGSSRRAAARRPAIPRGLS